MHNQECLAELARIAHIPEKHEWDGNRSLHPTSLASIAFRLGHDNGPSCGLMSVIVGSSTCRVLTSDPDAPENRFMFSFLISLFPPLGGFGWLTPCLI